MSSKIVGLVLAAGKGTRLKVDVAKPLLTLRNRPLVSYPLQALGSFFAAPDFKGSEIVTVTGHQREKVENLLSSQFNLKNFVFQKEQLGTGHAVSTFLNDFSSAGDFDWVIVICADTPAIETGHIQRLYDHAVANDLEAVVATTTVKNPRGYGRILRDSAKSGLIIVEEKDASDAQREINEVNSGFYIFKTDYLKKGVSSLDNNNASGEFYLTDLFRFDTKTDAVLFEDADSFLGVNDFTQLAHMASILNERKCRELALEGVYIHDPKSTFIDDSVRIEAAVEIQPGVRIEGDTLIKSGSFIGQGSILRNVRIEKDVIIEAYSHLDEAIVGDETTVGPFARLRAKVELGKKCRVGNFVEVKKSTFGDGSKSAHLSYIGDAEIGRRTNLGCGFITCNYDGAQKHKTVIGDDTFVGSDSQMIAPITLGSGVYIASGSTINKDVEDGAFAIARERQITKPGMAKKFIKTKK